jgi:isocitrate lyase
VEDDPTSGRKKGGKNKRLRRLFAIDAVHLSELARQYTRDAVKALVKTVRTSKSEAARVSAISTEGMAGRMRR